MSAPRAAAHRRFRITGMDCAEEIAALRREVGPLVGGEARLGFDLLAGTMVVAPEAAAASDREILAAVAKAGLTGRLWRGIESARGDDARRGHLVATLASAAALAAGFLWHAGRAGIAAALGAHGTAALPLGSRAAYGAAVVAGFFHVVPKAWLALRKGRPDMHLLMTLAVSGALLLGDWLEAATVAFLFALSLALEAWSVGRARRAIAALLDLVPPSARLLASGGESQVPPAQVPVGSHVAVLPGERIPLDGRILDGTTTLDLSPITGESRPLDRGPGDEVFAGTINGTGSLVVETTRPAEQTLVAKILRMVEEARARRSPIERWVDRFAAVYTPAVLALAALVALVPPLLLAAPWSAWAYRALVLLVIGCPCALVVATPVGMVAGLAAAARHGVLIKGGRYLEAAGTLRAVAFDKTGTLTSGRPRVLEVTPLAGHDERELLERLAALEARSGHPLAHAILEHAAKLGIVAAPATELRLLPGRGAAGRFGGKEFWVGSHRLLAERGQETPAIRGRLEAIAAAGRSAVVVGNDDHVCGLVAVADGVRERAGATVAALRALGVDRVAMLTGDHRATAEAIARELGIDEIAAELLPDEKVERVRALVARHRAVAMVGDGINDAPALAEATLGIAMGGAGTDAALETADVALLSDDLSRIPWLVGFSRRARAILRQNITFALAVKAAFALATAFGLATLWGAIAADLGATLLVVANALRLLRG